MANADDPGRAAWPEEDPPPELFHVRANGDVAMRHAMLGGGAWMPGSIRVFRAIDGFVYEIFPNDYRVPLRIGLYPTGPLLRLHRDLKSTLETTLQAPRPQRTGLTARERSLLGL